MVQDLEAGDRMDFQGMPGYLERAWMRGEEMNWYIVGSHWISCEVTSNIMGRATVRLYDGRVKTGKARKGLYGLLVDGQLEALN